ERLQANSRQEATAGDAQALDLELLVVDVQAAGGVVQENAVLLPVAQAAGGARVAVIAVGVGSRFLVQDQADNVVRAAVVELLLQRGIDDVVRRRHHVGEGSDPSQVVAVSAESTDVRHARISSGSRSRNAVF